MVASRAVQDVSAPPSLALGYLRGLFDLMRRQNAPLDQVLAVLGIDEEALRDPDRRYAHHLQTEVFAVAERVTGDAHVGLHAGQITHLMHFGLLGQLAMGCKTGRDLLNVHSRYNRLICDGTSFAYGRLLARSLHVCDNRSAARTKICPGLARPALEGAKKSR